MKRFIPVLFLLFAGLLKSSAQHYNVTTQLNQTYKPLANPTLITNSWDQNLFTTPNFGITYNWYHNTYNFDGNSGLFIFGAGVLAAEATDSIAFDIDGFYVGLKSRNNGSALNYEIDGTTGSHIIKMEWVNAGIDGGDTADFVNFQIWLYEANNTIEMHYGPSFIKNSKDFNAGNGGQGHTGPPVGTFTASTKHKDNGKVLALAYLTGDPDNPTVARTSSASLKSMPKSGTVYTFTDANATGLNEARALLSEFRLYPNPSNEFVTLEYFAGNGPVNISIQDMTGKCVRFVELMGNAQKQSTQISTADMKPGLYLVKLQSGTNTTIQKLMVAR
jgi:hypothetical protein